jgi:hypothetical protein
MRSESHQGSPEKAAVTLTDSSTLKSDSPKCCKDRLSDSLDSYSVTEVYRKSVQYLCESDSILSLLTSA